MKWIQPVVVVLLAVLLALLPACSGGSKDDSQNAARSKRDQQILALLHKLTQERSGTSTPVGKVPTRTELRDAFQPIATAVQDLMRQQESDREQVLTLSRELADFSRIVEGSLERGEKSSMTTLRTRLLKVEKDILEQQRRSKANREAILNTLNGAADRLDGLLQEIQTPPAKSTSQPAGGKAVDANLEAGTAAPKQGNSSALATYQILVAFLGISLIALVVLVVFFPSRLRSVPKAEFAAQPDGDALLELREVVNALSDLGPAPTQNDEASESLPKGPVAFAPEPRRHHLVLDEAEVNGVQDKLEDWLRQDPSVLTQPEPEVHAHDGVIELSFSTRPDLTPGEKVQFQDRLQRLLQAG